MVENCITWTVNQTEHRKKNDKTEETYSDIQKIIEKKCGVWFFSFIIFYHLYLVLSKAHG